MIGAKLLIICLLVSISIYLLILALKPISFLGISFFEGFLPEEFITKIFKTNYFNKLQFSRIDIWQKAIKLISERPLLGWGAATFPFVYILMGGIENAQHTHSMPLEIAQNHGIPAALILIFFVSLLYKGMVYYIY